MGRPIKLSIKKVVVRKKYYPRFRIKKSRVEQFRESMRDGEHIPPIFVGNEGDRYVVIEGAHRLAAAKLEGAKTIFAEFWHEKDPEMWLADASRLNDKARDPMSPKELREVARRLWLGGIKDTEKIARRMNRSTRFVQRALKPLRDSKTKKLQEKIVTLSEEGLSQRKIADKLSISRKKVRYALKKMGGPQTTNCRLGPTLESSGDPDNHISQNTGSKEEVSQQRAASAASSGTIHGSQSPAQAENIPEEAPDITESLDVPETKHNTQPAKVLQFPVKESYRNILLGDYSDEEKEEKLLKLLEEEEKQASKYDPRNEEDNAALDIYKMCISTMSNKKGYKAMRALELLKQLKWDLVQISEFLGEPLDFIRRVCIAAIGLQVAPGSAKETAKEKARSMLELSHDIVTAISNAIWAEYMMGPVGEGIPEWMEENLSESDLELVAKIASSPKATYIGEDIKYLVLGKVPARQRAKYYTELPPEEKEKIEHDMHEITVCFRKYRDLLNTGMYRGEALMCVVKTYNRTKVASNQVDEAILTCRKRGYL